jgi:cob(I)alamin adenosyltransferase
MALFTGKGDDGTTYKFDSKDRFSKASAIAEALGTVDELNSFLGLIKTKSQGNDFSAQLEQIQENLFIVQAELAGADKKINPEKVESMSQEINDIESELPPITTFLIAGGSELAAMLDVSRTIARRAERRVVAVVDEGKVQISAGTLAYLNRLSSMLYALARLSNHKFGITEGKPSYK